MIVALRLKWLRNAIVIAISRTKARCGNYTNNFKDVVIICSNMAPTHGDFHVVAVVNLQRWIKTDVRRRVDFDDVITVRRLPTVEHESYQETDLFRLQTGRLLIQRTFQNWNDVIVSRHFVVGYKRRVGQWVEQTKKQCRNGQCRKAAHHLWVWSHWAPLRTWQNINALHTYTYARLQAHIRYISLKMQKILHFFLEMYLRVPLIFLTPLICYNEPHHDTHDIYLFQLTKNNLKQLPIRNITWKLEFVSYIW